MYEENKLKALKNYIYSPLPENRDVVYFRAVDTLDTVKKLFAGVMQLKCRDKVHIAFEKDESNEGYYFLDIYSSEATKANAVFELGKLLSAERTAAFGNADSDITMIEDADYGYAVANASEDLKEIAPEIIGNCGSDAVVKKIEKLYHIKKLL
jgi:hydroxymethylpyrimidine pyrophosphatase-like HAD family hydrolase